jgi:type I restriction enzyme M protein
MIESTYLDPSQHGRVGVIVPHGVLFRGGSEGRIRQQLIEENLLDAVIGLPENLFYGTGIPAAILIFRRDKADDSVLFIDASREYEQGVNQNRLREQDRAKIVQTYRQRQSVDKYAYVATRAEIAENEFNLGIPRYVDTFDPEEEVSFASVNGEIEGASRRLDDLRIKMRSYLEELGLDE